jgi:Spy/CpxP family protein refolding chaperone
MRWLLAGLAMTGLAGAALAATDQPTSTAADSSANAVQPDQQGPADTPAHARHGGWDSAGGPQARRMGPSRWHRPNMMMRGRRFGEPMLDRPLLLAFRRLDLTDQQWQRVQAILEVQHLRSGAGGGARQERRAQIAALFDPADPHHNEAVQAIKDRAVARIDQAAHTQQALYEVLSPAQQTRLQQLIKQRRERMRERQQQRGARDGAGASPSGQ